MAENERELDALIAHLKAPTSGVEGDERTTRGSVRRSLEVAGWSDSVRIALRGSYESLSWGNLRTLLAARREIRLGQNDPDAAAAAMRQAWLASGPPLPATLKIGATGDPARVLLLGDTGDGSEAQAAVAFHLEARLHKADRPDAAAVIIQSDIVYPAGARDEYTTKFADVYEGIRMAHVPIYAVPGNHDWDDGTLSGFMAAFCGRDSTPESVYEARNSALTWLQRRLWSPPLVTPLRTLRRDNAASRTRAIAEPPQTHPYVALDIGGVLYIGIDTGYGSCIDRVQARWLIDTAEANSETPKILFTGKPLIVNGLRKPCPFAEDATTGEGALQGKFGSYRSVDDVVREPCNGFIAALGGDVHNYQRYRARVHRRDPKSFDLPYVVAGGGGVFIGQTYWIPPIAESAEVADATVSYREEETVLFPTRSHSFLYWDRLVRQSRSVASFATSVTLTAVAAAVALLAVAVGLLDWIFPVNVSSPSLWSIALLGSVAVGANTSARPIAPPARCLALAFAAAPAPVILWWMSSQRFLDIGVLTPGNRLGRSLIAAAFLGGVALLQIAESSLFGGDPWRRSVRRGLSYAACAVIGCGALWLVATSFGRNACRGWSYPAAVAIVATALIFFLWLTRSFPWQKLTVDTTVRAFHTELTSGAKTGLTRTIRNARRLGERQKIFSVFETFTDGRLKHRVRRPLTATGGDEFLPLYRSFLEIESQRENDMWSVRFTAFAVTGERTTDGGVQTDEGPVVVDRFTMQWSPGGPARFVIVDPSP